MCCPMVQLLLCDLTCHARLFGLSSGPYGFANFLQLPCCSPCCSCCWTSLHPVCLLVQGPGCNDNCLRERVVNVVTSLPFIFVGAHTMRYDVAT